MAVPIVTGQNYDQPVIAPPPASDALNSMGSPSPVTPPIGPRTPFLSCTPNVITLATVGGRDAISALNEPVPVWSLRTSRDLPVPMPIVSVFRAIHMTDISLGVFM